MKKIYLALSLFATMAASVTQSNAQSTLIHYWNFNNFDAVVTLPAIASLAADYSLIDTAKARVTYVPMPGVSAAYAASGATYCDFVAASDTAIDFDTVNLQLGAPSGNAFRTRNPTDSMELLLYIPSTGYKNLTLAFALESSSSIHGPAEQSYAYSVDSGSTWRTTGGGGGISMDTLLMDTVTATYDTFRRVTEHITDTQAYNNPKLVFRIEFQIHTNITSGNNRFDNITLEGTPLPGTDTTHINAGVAPVDPVVTPSYTLYPNPVANILEIDATTAGLKSVAIYNEIGQKIYSGLLNGKSSSVDVSNFTSGIYFISIADKDSGIAQNMKFIKQ